MIGADVTWFGTRCSFLLSFPSSGKWQCSNAHSCDLNRNVVWISVVKLYPRSDRKMICGCNIVRNKSLSNLAVNFAWFEAHLFNLMYRQCFVQHRYKSLVWCIKHARKYCVKEYSLYIGSCWDWAWFMLRINFSCFKFERQFHQVLLYFRLIQSNGCSLFHSKESVFNLWTDSHKHASKFGNFHFSTLKTQNQAI